MNKEELSAMVQEILRTLGSGEPESGKEKLANPQPAVKASGYKPTEPEAGESLGDITAVDLHQLYLVENAAQPERFRLLKERTPARLGCGRAGPRYKTQTLLRFRADHAAAQDAVFSQVPEQFPEENAMAALQTCCRSKEEYLTRPDLGRRLDEESSKKLTSLFPKPPKVLLVVGDGLSGAAVQANAPDCLAAIKEGLQAKGIEASQPVFVRYCRVGAGDHMGNLTNCQLVCMLVGERPGLVTDKSMSAYITYMPRTGVLESARTVVSNIHAQGTAAVEAGAHIASLIATILEKQVSGVALRGQT